MGHREQENYLGIFRVHSSIFVEEGHTQEEVIDKLKPHLEQAKGSYPNFPWDERVRMFQVRELPQLNGNPNESTESK